MANDPRLDPLLVEQFRREGFVVIDELLSDDELAYYEPLVTDAVATRKRHSRSAVRTRSRSTSASICGRTTRPSGR